MKRFYDKAEAVETESGFIVQLDGRPIKTQGGRPQIVPTRALAERLAAEWNAQGETIDPATFHARDTVDYAIDVVARDRAAIIDKLLSYGETDTLCYRADPDEPFRRRQQEVWEPLVTALEAREGVSMQRVSGIVHRPQPSDTMARLRTRLERLDRFALAALEQLTALATSLCIGLGALEEDADGETLWDAANLEEDWQAENWGHDAEAAAVRDQRRAAFLKALDFARAA